MANPSARRARELFSYDKETGLLIRKMSRGNSKAGSSVGWSNGFYLKVMCDGRVYGVHQIAWLIVTGNWPEYEIDHRDLDGTNNRWGNLRLATHAQNMMNKSRYANNSSGFKGVSIHRGWSRKKPYAARICKNHRLISLGYFATAEEAHEAYIRAANSLFGKFARYK